LKLEAEKLAREKRPYTHFALVKTPSAGGGVPRIAVYVDGVCACDTGAVAASVKVARDAFEPAKENKDALPATHQVAQAGEVVTIVYLLDGTAREFAAWHWPLSAELVGRVFRVGLDSLVSNDRNNERSVSDTAQFYSSQRLSTALPNFKALAAQDKSLQLLAGPRPLPSWLRKVAPADTKADTVNAASSLLPVEPGSYLRVTRTVTKRDATLGRFSLAMDVRFSALPPKHTKMCLLCVPIREKSGAAAAPASKADVKTTDAKAAPTSKPADGSWSW
jgi:hypothetical protein